MKKIFAIISFLLLILPFAGKSEILIEKPDNFSLTEDNEMAVLTWKNTDSPTFSASILFRSAIPIENYFSYEAVVGFCDKIYEGTEESYIDTGLDKNLPHYYILFSRDKAGNYSKATIIEKLPLKENDNTNNTDYRTTSNLSGASPQVVNEVTFNEAGIIYNYNKEIETEQGGSVSRLALLVIVKSPHDLEKKDINSISYFIHSGTPTTIILGSGERAGVLNSYLSVFNKLPRNVLEWQDVIKIANGRWPNERNLDYEEKAADVFFSSIYEREPNMDNPNDNAAVTVIAYGLRPAQRNLESEKNAINIFRSIFKKTPIESSDWDLVRAIAYSGASR